MDSSGPAIRVALLSKALVAASYRRKAELIGAHPGVELHVIAPRLWRDGSVERPFEPGRAEGYELEVVPIARPGGFHTHFYPGLGSVIRRIRPHLVHVDEEPYNLATFLALRAARSSGASSLFFTWQNLRRAYPPPFGWFERFAYGVVGGALAGSRTAADVLRAKGYDGALWVVPQFGVDEAVFSPRGQGAGGGFERPFVVGYAGRLVPAKGVDVLLEAFSLSPKSWRIEIVGAGEGAAELHRLAERLGVAGSVSWRPWLTSAEMPSFYRALDAFVLPSRSTPRWIEQFGRVMVEAMACGVPCVGSDSGEIPNVLGDAGVVVPEGDPRALADALTALAGDRERRRWLSDAGRRRVLARFTMRRVADETVRAYRAVLEGSGPVVGRLRADGGAI